MDMSNCSQHLVIENAYVKYRYDQLRDSNLQLRVELADLKRKLENAYKTQANTILMLYEKNQDLLKIIDQIPPTPRRPKKLRSLVEMNWNDVELQLEVQENNKFD